MAWRVVVSTAKYSACRSDLSFVGDGTRQHSGMRYLPQSDSKITINMAEQIHSIHRGENLANPYIPGTTNYQSVRFLGDLRRR